MDARRRLKFAAIRELVHELLVGGTLSLAQGHFTYFHSPIAGKEGPVARFIYKYPFAEN